MVILKSIKNVLAFQYTAGKLLHNILLAPNSHGTNVHALYIYVIVM